MVSNYPYRSPTTSLSGLPSSDSSTSWCKRVVLSLNAIVVSAVAIVAFATAVVGTAVALIVTAAGVGALVVIDLPLLESVPVG